MAKTNEECDKPKYVPPSVFQQRIIVDKLYVKPDATEKQIELLKKMHPEAEIIIEEE